MEKGNPSPNQLMDNRIQNSLEEPGTEPKVKTAVGNLHKADSLTTHIKLSVMVYEILQWNCCGLKVNYNELLILQSLTLLLFVFRKLSSKMKWK